MQVTPSPTRVFPALPKRRTPLPLRIDFSAEETRQIALGFEPKAMEDKWIVHTDGNWLIFRRSWTGRAIYGLLFERSDSGSRVVDAWVYRQGSQRNANDVSYESALVQYLISTHLLGRLAEFPMPGDPGAMPDPVFKHHVVGHN